MNALNRLIATCIGALVCGLYVSAQKYNGNTGLMTVPTAEMAAAGTFRGEASYLSKETTPEQFIYHDEKYATFNYGAGMTIFSWLEMSYICSLLKYDKGTGANAKGGYYNQDRRINVKVRPIKEGKWWPAVAVGMDDTGRFRKVKTDTPHTNSYFQNYYIVGSKHLEVGGMELGLHLGYHQYSAHINHEKDGVFGGVSVRPDFYRDLRFMADWNGKQINVGADALLWKHLFAQVFLTDGKYVSGGIAYHYTIPY